MYKDFNQNPFASFDQRHGVQNLSESSATTIDAFDAKYGQEDYELSTLNSIGEGVDDGMLGMHGTGLLAIQSPELIDSYSAHFAERVKERAQETTPEHQAYSSEISGHIDAVDESVGFWDTMSTSYDLAEHFLTNKESYYESVKTMARSAPTIAVTTAVGAKAGAPLGPYGVMGGGIAGTATGSMIIETGAYLEELVYEYVDDPSDPQQIKELLSDKGFLSWAKDKAVAKGAGVAVWDVATTAVGLGIFTASARRLKKNVDRLNKEFKTDLVKGRLNKDYNNKLEALADQYRGATSTASKLKKGGVVFGVETFGEGAGEYTGQVLAGDEASLGSALHESLTGGGISTVQTAVSNLLAGKAKEVDLNTLLDRSYELDTEPYTDLNEKIKVDKQASKYKLSDAVLTERGAQLARIQDMFKDERGVYDNATGRLQEVVDEISRRKIELQSSKLGEDLIGDGLSAEAAERKRVPVKADNSVGLAEIQAIEEENRNKLNIIERESTGSSEIGGSYSASETETAGAGSQVGTDVSAVDGAIGESENKAIKEELRNRHERNSSGGVDGSYSADEVNVSGTAPKGAASDVTGAIGVDAVKKEEALLGNLPASEAGKVGTPKAPAGGLIVHGSDKVDMYGGSVPASQKELDFKSSEYAKAIEPIVTEIKKQIATTSASSDEGKAERIKLNGRIKDLRNRTGLESETFWKGLPDKAPDKESTPKNEKPLKSEASLPAKQPADQSEVDKSWVLTSSGVEVSIDPESIVSLGDGLYSISSEQSGVSGQYKIDIDMYDAPALISVDYSESASTNEVDQSTTDNSTQGEVNEEANNEETDVRNREGGEGRSEEADDETKLRQSNGYNIPLTSEERRFFDAIKAHIDRDTKSIAPARQELKDLYETFKNGKSADKDEQAILSYLLKNIAVGKDGKISVKVLVTKFRDVTAARIADASVNARNSNDKTLEIVQDALVNRGYNVPKNFSELLFGAGGKRGSANFKEGQHKRGFLADYRDQKYGGLSIDNGGFADDVSTTNLSIEDTNIDYDQEDSSDLSVDNMNTIDGKEDLTLNNEAEMLDDGDDAGSNASEISTGAVAEGGMFGEASIKSKSEALKEIQDHNLREIDSELEQIAEEKQSMEQEESNLRSQIEKAKKDGDKKVQARAEGTLQWIEKDRAQRVKDLRGRFIGQVADEVTTDESLDVFNKGDAGNTARAFDRAANKKGVSHKAESSSTSFKSEVSGSINDPLYEGQIIYETPVTVKKVPVKLSVRNLIKRLSRIITKNIGWALRHNLSEPTIREEAILKASINDLIQSGRIPSHAFSSLKGIVIGGKSRSMGYVPSKQVIRVSLDLMDEYTDALQSPETGQSIHIFREFRDGIAHELWHSVDINSSGESISGAMDLFDVKKDGSLAYKAEGHYSRHENSQDEDASSAVGSFFRYPITDKETFTDGQYRAEFFAQLGAFYTSRPELFKASFGSDAFTLFDSLSKSDNIGVSDNILLGESNGRNDRATDRRKNKEVKRVPIIRSGDEANNNFRGENGNESSSLSSQWRGDSARNRGVRNDSRRAEDMGSVDQGRGGAGEESVVDQSTYDPMDDFKSGIGKSKKLTFKEKISAVLDGWSDKLRQGMFDKSHAIKRNAEISARAQGLDKPVLTDWMRSRMVSSAREKVLAMINYGKLIVNKDGDVQLDQSSIKVDANGMITQSSGLASILDPLAGKVDDFLSYMVAKRASELPEDVSLPFKNRAAAIKAGLSLRNGNEQSFDKALAEFQSLHESVVDIAVSSGLVGQKEADIWKGGAYIPFYRVLEDTESSGLATLGGLTKQEAYKKIHGSELNINDPLENVLMNWNHLLNASMSNQAAVGAIKTALSLKLSDISKNAGEVAVANVLHDPEGLFGEKIENSKIKHGSDMVYIRHNGREVWVRINDELTLRSLTASKPIGSGSMAMRVGRKAKSMLTTMVTISPEFRVRNLIRDSIHVLGISQLKGSQMGLNPLSSGWNGTKEDSLHYARMLASGGSFRFGHQLGGDPDASRRLITEGVKHSQILDSEEKFQTLFGKIKDGVETGLGKWQDIGSRAENVNRAALYDSVIEAGGTELEAAFAARDLLAFDVQGEWAAIRMLSQLVPFMNARLQGLDKLGRAGIDKEQRARLLAVAGAYGLTSAAIFMAMKDDEDYRELKQWQRDTYIAVKLPMLTGDTMFFIPRPFEIGIAGVFAERAIETFINDFDEDSRELFAGRMFHALTDTLAMNPVPQALKPILDVYANYDSFRDSPIEGWGKSGLSPEARVTSWTSALGKVSSSAVRELSLGNIDMSPMQADYLIKGYLGWVGGTAMMITDGGIDLLTENDKPSTHWDDYFIVKAFMQRGGGATSTRIGQVMYDIRTEANMAYKTIKDYRAIGEYEKAAEYASNHSDALAMRKAVNRTAKKLTKYRTKIKLVYANKNLTADEKQVYIDRYNDLIQEAQRRVMNKYGKS